MTCRQAEPLLARAADGTLDADRGAALARHLDGCPDCSDALDAQRAMRGLLAARPEAPVPLGFATRVMANLEDASGRARPRTEGQDTGLAGWLGAVDWQAWTLRLAPVAGALFVGAAIGLGPSTEVAEAGVSDYADVVTEWMAEETTDGVTPDAAIEAVTQFWQDAGETTDDLLIDVLLATDPAGDLPGASEAGR
jgi:anti-sigma factor RsiW